MFSSCRISITFRKMDESKLPYKFSPDPELEGIKPLIISRLNKRVKEQDAVGNLDIQQHKDENVESESDNTSSEEEEGLFHVENESPPLNGSFRKPKVNKFGRRSRQ